MQRVDIARHNGLQCHDDAGRRHDGVYRAVRPWGTPGMLCMAPLSDEVARQLVDQYGSQANPSEMVTLRCDDVASLVNTVAQSDAIFLGVIAATQSGLKDGSLVELHLKPKLVASARFAYVTLAGRTEAPAMAYFRGFISDQLRD